MIKLWIVLSRHDERVFGPFDNEAQAIQYARDKKWPKGYMTRVIEPIA